MEKANGKFGNTVTPNDGRGVNCILVATLIGVFRLKTIFGDRLPTRLMETQTTQT